MNLLDTGFGHAAQVLRTAYPDHTAWNSPAAYAIREDFDRLIEELEAAHKLILAVAVVEFVVERV